jgi:ABC-type molybdate transport system substrate-binding protein
MRGGIPIVVFIISFAISVFLFLICSYILGITTDQLTPLANQTMTVAHAGSYNALLQGFQKIFGTFTFITMIGIIAAYALDSHRNEGEEFQYYDKYR